MAGRRRGGALDRDARQQWRRDAKGGAWPRREGRRRAATAKGGAGARAVRRRAATRPRPRAYWQLTGFALGCASLGSASPTDSSSALSCVLPGVPFGPSEVWSHELLRVGGERRVEGELVEQHLADLEQVELVVARVELHDHAQHLAGLVLGDRVLVDRAEHAVASVGEQVGRDAAPRLAEVLERLAQVVDVHRDVAERVAVGSRDDGQVDLERRDHDARRVRRVARDADALGVAVGAALDPSDGDGRSPEADAPGSADCSTVGRRLLEDRARGGRIGVGEQPGDDQDDAQRRQQRGQEPRAGDGDDGGGTRGHGAPS